MLRHPIRRFLAGLRTASVGLRFSLGSAYFLAGATLIGLAALDADNNLLMMLFALCTAVTALNLLAGWRVLRGLVVQRVLPDVLVAGEPVVIRYAVTNTRSWGWARCLHLRDVLPAGAPMTVPEAFVPRLRSGETAILNVPAMASTRGRIPFSTIEIETDFPFGIFRKLVRVSAPNEAIVFPTLGRLLTNIKAAPQSSDASLNGGRTLRTAGDEEFYGIREYRIGDNPRRIHWRRSARTGQLVIREMARSRDHQFWCVVNTLIDPDDDAQVGRLESAISCVATVVCDALERNARIGLISNGEPMLVLPPRGGRAHRPRLLKELAMRARNVDRPLAAELQRVAWPARWRGRCLLFGAAENEDLAAAQRLLTHALGPTAIYVPGESAFDDLFEANPSTVALASRPGGVNCGTAVSAVDSTGGIHVSRFGVWHGQAGEARRR